MRSSRLPVIAALGFTLVAPAVLIALAGGPVFAEPGDAVPSAAAASASPTASPDPTFDYVPGNPVTFAVAPPPPPVPTPVPTTSPTPEPVIPPQDQPTPTITPVAAPSAAAIAAPRSTDPPQAAEAAPVDAVVEDQSNMLTNMLPTFADFVEHPELVAAGVATALGLMTLVVLPAELLNATLSARYASLFAWAAALAPASVKKAGSRVTTRVQARPIIGGLTITAAAALIFCFVDPKFGLTLPSLRLFLALMLGLFVIGYLASAITALILRERWHLSSALQPRPLALLLTIVGVVASRLLDFSPGILVGLVFGLTVAGLPEGSRAAARPVLVRAGVMLSLGIAAWVAYNMFFAGGTHGAEALAAASASGGEGGGGHESTAPVGQDSFFTALGAESLHAITAEGITALVVCLLPFRFLEGREIYKSSKRLWTFVYLTVLVAFCVLVLSSQHNWEVLGKSPWGWLGFVAAWAVVALGLYLYLARREAKEEARERAEGREPVEEIIGD